MKLGKYKINLSERGKHYGELLGGWLCIAVMFISLSAVGTWAVSGFGELETSEQVQAERVELSGYSTLQVTHIYEDGCLDLYDTEKETYQFYCEDITFYEE